MGQTSGNTRLTVRHRVMDAGEFRMQRFRERQLEPPGDDDEELELPEQLQNEGQEDGRSDGEGSDKEGSDREEGSDKDEEKEKGNESDASKCFFYYLLFYAGIVLLLRPWIKIFRLH